ncbi:BREX-2 system adenine-specific DNA-methyltransferase PglX [Actinokineospora sp. NBRC 105648]|uniref:BREX-2 system adenine-specific DNA-methyltransferase PglX n=1 Tax=Actinokineospora sp. NBRC 105648 TaxID=3032206 RepID=UPI0024A55860|nr:BREX-2 system adenine-specific DNA-methyltransferase PglX [Actinokineospora sp. NBRC 105648]GLZ41162.1 DNA methylase [Actinokineospora sp. NBRC 105648]
MTEAVPSGVDQRALLADLRKQVVLLEDDLRGRSEEAEFAEPLVKEYKTAFDAKRTAATYESWRDERVTQVAVAWVLGTVFVRFCEDNRLIDDPYLAGPGERLTDAEDRHEAYFRANPAKNDRDWIVEAFNHLAESNDTVAGLFDARYNPLWEITPSFETATALIGFWRRRGADGVIVHDFTDPKLDTRFLGDLYQDLSEAARKTYALLQTPEFVEEFILDLTLTPAIEEFGLDGLRTIDPACGSGHFLLGIFHRLFEAWQKKSPAAERWDLIRRSLESVHGCDKNPFAASIARFRLLIAALKAAEVKTLHAQKFPINVAVGDSLLHGRGAPVWQQGELFADEDPFTYRTEDVDNYISKCDLLGRSSYHVVVGNPPYITPKDKQDNENYRTGYDSCSGTYALSVPFVECSFKLAQRNQGEDRNSGFVGQLTANSFMKREFGKKLVEDFFHTVSLTHVIDTSGVYIPGHGTPTVILAGRNCAGRTADVLRAILGVQGEPFEPDVPSAGLVWSAIVDNWDKNPVDTPWVSVRDVQSADFRQHPWSLSGGEASAVFEIVDTKRCKLRQLLEGSVGRGIRAGADEAFTRPTRFLENRIPSRPIMPLLIGEDVRDWQTRSSVAIWYPYRSDLDTDLLENELWVWRTMLAARRTFQGDMRASGLHWWEYMQHTASAYRSELSIAFPFVATSNHFVLDRGNRVFNRTAPVIKLADTVDEDEHLALLGVLNSSTASFWLKQVCHDKGNGGIGGGIASEDWEKFYEFTGTKLQEFPLPEEFPLKYGRALDGLAQALAKCEPAAVEKQAVPTRARLDAAKSEHERIRARMIVLQEELDWDTYRLYGLIATAEADRLVVKERDEVPGIALGERAFEIVLARKIAAGDLETTWFARHGSTPITEIPSHWPQWYQDIVQARIDIIEKRKDIALIERPECKRRWSAESWEKKEERALRSWLLDRCEREDLWFALRDGLKQPRTLTVNQLADQLRDDEDINSVAQLYAADHLNRRDVTLAQVLEVIVADQHVPYLAALRYKDTGLRKRAQWERVWEQQREEDRTGKRLAIAVPPKYTTADFRKVSYWSHRGKLDVPKERFISYPDAGPESDPTLLLGWAGWDHKDQAQALVNTINERTEQSGWDAARLTPLVAGLAEVMPWVVQWHSGYDAEWDGDPAEEYQAFLRDQQALHRLTDGELAGWRPQVSRGRKAAVRSRKSTVEAEQIDMTEAGS